LRLAVSAQHAGSTLKIEIMLSKAASVGGLHQWFFIFGAENKSYQQAKL
jgi:hypothetical protein